MTQKILISTTYITTKIALVENNIVTEIIIERNDKISLIGNIYRGIVSRIVPGMNAAFVNIGLKHPAFLQSDLPMHQGQTLLVQVTREPTGTKHARLTTKISLPSRYVILLPYASSNLLKISSRIKSSQERQRLENIFLVNIPKYGLIVRTAAERVNERLLFNDLEFLYNLWQDIQDTRINSLIYKELPVHLRTIRDLANSSSCKIKTDSYEVFQEITKFAKQFIPDLIPQIEYYSAKLPLFEQYSININKYLEPKVMLDSGGYIIIESTEAMTTIDVNTGSYIGENDLAKTIFKTNLEAATTITRELKLRNISGIIIIDFIDMQLIKYKQQILATLKQGFINDYVKISEISSLGLVQMTRKRNRDSLEQVLCKKCPTCEGRGLVMNN